MENKGPTGSLRMIHLLEPRAKERYAVQTNETTSDDSLRVRHRACNSAAMIARKENLEAGGASQFDSRKNASK